MGERVERRLLARLVNVFTKTPVLDIIARKERLLKS